MSNDEDLEDEHVTADMCRQVTAQSAEGAAVVKWALRMEGILHRIEEFPEHEPHLEADERYADPRKLAAAALHAPINKPLARWLRSYRTSPMGTRKLPPMEPT